ncbi:uncharacterized protein SCHCODRAFT_02307122 [Schizophyllum commune H4-8]|uniref:uncharacterized protein n=1 Tax=Schizophyllum commune (strain H4-8 / FGSC 9210) TaxID=578458 RepID=UPI00215F406F|nr:uncharacterized protein SCHCODRAFT_02307122 [Schizophyllum commune H4-8]KAI5890969.1 hypothetical protein SCHCODRAFT_02307122 [Schizophyllum commune H4-8]
MLGPSRHTLLGLAGGAMTIHFAAAQVDFPCCQPSVYCLETWGTSNGQCWESRSKTRQARAIPEFQIRIVYDQR